MKALVTGGGGFLGGAVVRQLLNRGDAVRSFTRTRYPWLDDLGIEQVLGDLADPVAVMKAVEGCDVVIHVAAKAGVWGRFTDYYRVNVVGTKNVIAACRNAGVGRLVYTSTPSVVYSGPVENGNESLPYPKRYTAAYPQTKAIAERAILAANGPDLLTVALRPHLIWGPGDPHLIPRVLARARAGKLRRVGTGPVMVDVTYVDNAATAHVLAADRLRPEASVAGKAYFISNGEPVDLWAFLNRVLEVAGLPPVTKTISPWKARFAGRVLETVYRTLRLPGEPAMTRFVAAQLSTPHWFDISAARRDLGYEPRVSIDDGLKRLAMTL
jgi:nucleoside-diphosphate-sugar epimerase